MLPAPRVVVIDDNPEHLKGLVEGLNRYGAACLQVHFNGDAADIQKCPHVRVIFADLHLNEGAPGDEYEKHFAIIGGILEESIVPAGPYIIVLWTRFADQAGALQKFLAERLIGVSKPFSIIPLDKMVHLNPDGSVKDPTALVAAITAIVQNQPQIGALLNWEERVLGAAASTVGAILGLAGENVGDDLPKRIGRLLFHLAEGAVGEGHVESDRFRAVNEALLPILADRVGNLRQQEGDDPWRRAFDEEDTRSSLDGDDAARLNRFSHIADCPADFGGERGAVIELPADIAAGFETTFDMPEITAAAEQFGCKDFLAGNAKFAWRLVQIQASCDHAQRQPGPLPFLLALEMPSESVKGSSPQALWISPACRINDATRSIAASARFQIALPRAAAKAAKAIYRIREPLIGELLYKVHSYGARPGMITFRHKKAKPALAKKA